MLNKKEKAVMKVIYFEASAKGGKCLISPLHILTSIPYKIDFKKEDMDAVMKVLALDDYFEVVETRKKEQPIYCITLHQKGHAFIREIINEKRAIRFKIVLTVCGVIGGFILSKILQAFG